MAKFNINITANDAESAEKILDVVETTVKTNPTIDAEKVEVNLSLRDEVEQPDDTPYMAPPGY